MTDADEFTDATAAPVVKETPSPAKARRSNGKSKKQHVTVTPEILSFKLDPDTHPTVILRLANPSNQAKVAFKVKTTAPKNYLVRPNQGLIDSASSAEVQVILQSKHCAETLVGAAAKSPAPCGDRFLVQTMLVSDDTYDDVARMHPKDAASALTNMWRDSAKDRVVNKRFRVHYEYPEDLMSVAVRLVQQAKQQQAAANAEGGGEDGGSGAGGGDAPPRGGDGGSAAGAGGAAPGDAAELSVENAFEASSAPPTTSSSGGGGGGDGEAKTGDSAPVTVSKAEMSKMVEDRKKFDELVQYTVKLTAERQKLVTNLEKAKKQLESNARNPVKPPPAARVSSSGFVMWQVLLVAFLAFLIGRYFA